MVKEHRPRIKKYDLVYDAKQNSQDCGCSLFCIQLLTEEFIKNRDFATGCKLGTILSDHISNDKNLNTDEKTDQILKIHLRIMQNS